jgi:hypothetical protein
MKEKYLSEIKSGIIGLNQYQYIRGGSYHSEHNVTEILDRIHEPSSPQYEPADPIYC